MLREPGLELDREVARRLGEKAPSVPPYSTDPRAADDLISRLAGSGVTTACEKLGGLWYCALSTTFRKTPERLATGTGTSRPLALCRAVMNLNDEHLRPHPEGPAAKGNPSG